MSDTPFKSKEDGDVHQSVVHTHPVPRHTNAEPSAKKAADLESMARLVEHLIPTFKKEEERQFYREIARPTEQQRVIFCDRCGETTEVKTSLSTRSCWR